MVFAPNIKPLEADLEGLVVDINYSKFVAMDFVIGREGVPYFIEANALPMFTRPHSLLYGNELVELLLGIYGRELRYGINVLPSNKRATSMAGEDTNDLCLRLDNMGVGYATFPNSKLRLDKKGLYYVRDGKKKRFDVLLNRQPRARLYKKIPKARRLELKLISPPELAFVKSKNRTTKMVAPYVPTPDNWLIKRKKTLMKKARELDEMCDGGGLPIGILKPLKGSMARGISFLYGPDVPKGRMKGAHVLQRWIPSWLYCGRVAAVRAFFVDGKASSGLVYTAPARLRSREPDRLRFMPTQYGGLMTKLSEPANNELKKYVLAAGYAIERAIQEQERVRGNR